MIFCYACIDLPFQDHVIPHASDGSEPCLLETANNVESELTIKDDFPIILSSVWSAPYCRCCRSVYANVPRC